MTESKDERSKRIHEEFERRLPEIWKKARINAHLMVKEYVARLRTESSTKRSEELFTIEECVLCGCTDVPNKNLELPIGVGGLVSVTVQGAQCIQCGESYYDSEDIEGIRELKKLSKQREYERQIKVIRLQSKEYRESSARASRDEDDVEE